MRRAPSPICTSYNEARSFSQTFFEPHLTEKLSLLTVILTHV